ncbi:hypothetical protein BP5796_04937 [Coleophoma crateriformis]|uniref:Phosphatidate phosphatase APP1 catalytic domain-containing protein n=1 Tax=Coleophoma crateriformis TaxID=565419 RepID=A0A3D8SAW9_9HELO|nr:hypothetical protein BP5796_04937 [Coleophoma crateriformis]
MTVKKTIGLVRERATEAISSMQGRGQSSQESEMETQTRRERGFHQAEASLPDTRAASPGTTAKGERPSEFTDLLSYLGPLNPFSKQITDKDTVWLLDNTAYRNTKTHQWESEFVVAVFEQNTGRDVSAVVADIAEKIGLAEDEAAEATIRRRLTPFMQNILPGRAVNVNFGRREKLKLGPGGRNGISSDIRSLPDARNGEVVVSTALVPQGADGLLEMNTVYAEPDGWAIISDIDDTIKITQTSDPIGILRSTFISPATPVAGMPELYAYIQTLVTTSAPFFYLSASPYNLYPFLTGFRRQHFPQGTMILRDASWMNLAGLLSNLTLGTQDYKTERMTKIHSWLPRRKMICIGDSTQSDPEAYGEMYRNFGGWVHLILIRKVTDIAAVGLQAKNEPQRFQQAFKGVPSNRWFVFETPEQCYQIINDVVQSTA